VLARRDATQNRGEWVVTIDRTYVLDHSHSGSSLATLRGTPPEEIRPLGTSIFPGHHLGWDPRRVISQEKRVSNVLPSEGETVKNSPCQQKAGSGRMAKERGLNLN
jgi:hypothetical protein